MINILNYYAATNVIVEILAALVVAFLLLTEIPRRKLYGRMVTKLFLQMLMVCEVMLVSDIVCNAFYRQQNSWVYRISWLILCITFYLMMLLFGHYVMQLISQTEKPGIFWTILIDSACTGGILVWIFAGFTENIVLHSESGMERGPYYWLGQTPGHVIAILLLLLILRYRKAIGTRYLVILFTYIVMPVFGVWLHYVIPALQLQYAMMAYASLLFYLMIHSEREQELALRLERSQAELAASQIKPHFIFNTLNAIYYLCEEDPQKAQEGIAVFSDYLRNNIDSLEITQPIPFSKELEHIHHYLDIQKMRFGDQLEVTFDLETEDFSIPVLTVEPLVENAVRYGLASEGGIGRVIISTREKDEQIEIKISDNGKGFEPSSVPMDGRTHLGLKSVQTRLDQMTGGEIEIRSEKGKGTTVTIRLRKERPA